eukprot:1742365-Amphidinium_carterae.1
MSVWTVDGTSCKEFRVQHEAIFLQAQTTKYETRHLRRDFVGHFKILHRENTTCCNPSVEATGRNS